MRLTVTGQLSAGLFNALLAESAPCIQGTDPELLLDLSGVVWAYPSGLVPLASLLNMLQAQNVRVQVVAYPVDSICSYLCLVNFFERIGAKSPCDRTVGLSGDRALEIVALEHPQIEKEVQSKLLRLLSKLPKDINATDVSRKSFIDACGELVSNTRHGFVAPAEADAVRETPGVLLQAQFYPKRRGGVVELCVCDRGWGVKRSMEGEHLEHFKSHREAIEAALVFRNRNPQGGGQGLGLSALHSYIKKNGGTLGIRSGDAFKTQLGNDGAPCTEQLAMWNGTIVVVEILVEKSADLSKIQKRFTLEAEG